MQLLIYSLSPWSIADSAFDVYGDSITRVTGQISDLTLGAIKEKPNVVFLHGFDDEESLENAAKQLASALPNAVIIPHCTHLDPNFLLRLMRLGIREVLSSDSPENIREVLKRTREYLTNFQERDTKSARLVGLIAAKGGDGSSCLAANLGYAIAQDVKVKVLAIDLSLPFGDLDMFLTNMTPSHNLSHFSEEIERLDGSLLESMTQHISADLHFIPAPAIFDEALKVNATHIQKLIELARQHYRYVILDLANQINPLSLAVLQNLDDLVIVASNNMPSIRRASQILRLWEELGRNSENVSLIINRYDNGADLDIAQINRAIGKVIAETLPEDREVVEEALLKGKPLLQFNPKSPLARAIRRWSVRWTGITLKEEKSLWQRLKTK